MSILRFESRTPRNLQGMYNYIIDDRKTSPDLIFGLGVNPMDAVTEMKLVHRIYGRYNLTHEYKQIIFSFDEGIKIDKDVLLEVCVRIGYALMLDERQVLGAIHGMGTSRIHCHYLINYVGVDGSLLRQKFSVIFYKRRINEILSEYGLTPIHFGAGNKKPEHLKNASA